MARVDFFHFNYWGTAELQYFFTCIDPILIGCFHLHSTFNFTINQLLHSRSIFNGTSVQFSTGIKTPIFLPISSFRSAPKAEQKILQSSVSFGAACKFIFGWVSYSYFIFYISSYIELRSSKTIMSE